MGLIAMSKSSQQVHRKRHSTKVEVESAAKADEMRCSKPIEIACSDGQAMASWSLRIVLRPLKRGFSVWCCGDQFEGREGQYHRISASNRSLSWRTAYQALSPNPNLKVWGDFWSEVEIHGLHGLHAEVLKLALIVDDSQPSCHQEIGDWLIRLSERDFTVLLKGKMSLDEEVADFNLGGQPSTVLGQLGYLLALLKELNLSQAPIEEVRDFANLGSDTDLSTLLSELGQKKLVQFTHRYQVVTSAEPMKEGQGETRNQAWARLCDGPQPRLIDLRVQLIEMWLKEEHKPNGNDGSVWSIVLWLTGLESGDTESVISELSQAHEGTLSNFVDTLHALIQIEETKRTGNQSGYRSLAEARSLHQIDQHLNCVKQFLELSQSSQNNRQRNPKAHTDDERNPLDILNLQFDPAEVACIESLVLEPNTKLEELFASFAIAWEDSLGSNRLIVLFDKQVAMRDASGHWSRASHNITTGQLIAQGYKLMDFYQSQSFGETAREAVKNVPPAIVSSL